MNTQVEFILLDSNSQLPDTALSKLAELYMGYDRVLVLAENRKFLELLDELLWHNSDKIFIPYSMDCECYGMSAAVLLTNCQPDRIRYSALLNIGVQIPEKPEQFRTITELVQTDDESIEKARGHYKFYRSMGFTISHHHMA